MSDKLRDQDRPTVLGYELDKVTLLPIRRTIDTTRSGDYGAAPIGDGKFRMIPSGASNGVRQGVRMELNAENARLLLEKFDFAKLFVEELGWDRHKAALPVEISGTSHTLRAVAEKRGMVAWVCEAPAGQQIPDRVTRKKIEHQVAKTTLEHLIIFTDSKRAEQIWCWARREAGKPASVLEHFWYASSGNRGFLQKLAAIAFSLEEEESLTLVDVTARARAAFDGDVVDFAERCKRLSA